MHMFKWLRRTVSPLLLSISFLLTAIQLPAQQSAVFENRALYDALKKFDLKGKISVSNLALKRDRAEMTFTGDFYFAAPVNGKITGAVFIGNGTFKAPAPPIQFEKENLVRFLNTDIAESDFQTAVLRFSDDTYTILGKGADENAAASSDAQKLAAELELRMMKETGANISSRLLVSLQNNESPGIFLAQFDKGKRGRFTLLIDPQTRIPSSAFGINGGEKVLVFAYEPYVYTNDVWIATYASDDFDKNKASYSDEFDIVNPLHYKMEVDLREARKILHTQMKIDFEALTDNIRTIPLLLNESLSEFDSVRLREAMRTKSVKFNDKDIPFIQEDWEMGLTVLLPQAFKKGEKFSIDLTVEGDFIDNQDVYLNVAYPQDNTTWYPRHGYLKRSTFDIVFRHSKNDKVASVGKRIREEAWPGSNDDMLTEYIMDKPISFATFAAGKLERYNQQRKLKFGDMNLEFFKVPASVENIKEEFVLTEFGNSLDYFGEYFGAYPYEVFRGTMHPFNFGQGFPTLLLIPRADQARQAVYAFIAHEASHQWWGNLVAWRSYRDQWLSEGFARYSGMLYTGLRDSVKSQRELIEDARYIMPFPPKTDKGVGKGKVAEIGPLILGLRLRTRNSINAYQDLIYDKGALVLRMLHYLLTDPNTGSGQAFFNMMSDFVKQYQNKAARTEDFIRVAGAHFANAPIGKMFGLKDLSWFFQEWVYEAKLPSYRMEYSLEPGENGQMVLSGTIYQDNAGPNWFMPLPVVCKFPGKQVGRLTVYANGPQTPFKMALPAKPDSIELDPDLWIMSEKTTTKKK
jgi:hypothetical protein